MKKFLIYIFMFLMTESATFANVPLQNALKNPVNEPNYLSVFWALIFVVALIYVTGIVYTKLNLVGSKVVKKVKQNFETDKIFILSTMPMSNGKSLHVIEVNGEKLLIGVAQNNISLIKELKRKVNVSYDEFASYDEQPKADEKPKYDSVVSEQVDEKIDLAKDGLEEIFNLEDKSVLDETDYGLYKKYL